MSGEPVPLIVAVAPNGGRRGKADHPALPLTPAEIGTAAAGCCEAGAALVHVHVRDGDGRHVLDADRYRDATAAIRNAVGDRLIVQVTTEAAGRYRAAEQMALVRELKPEAVSLALRELAPDPADEAELAAFLTWLTRERILPQYILYTAAEAARFRALWQRGIIPSERPSVLFVLGRHGPEQRSRPADLAGFLVPPPDGLEWMVCAFGAVEATCAVAAAALGGHVRIGFENNLALVDGGLAADNAALVAQFVGGTSLVGRPLADADVARTVFHRGGFLGQTGRAAESRSLRIDPPGSTIMGGTT